MTYLKKILVNKYEQEVDATLREATGVYGAKVFSKVGIKDILDITKGKNLLTSEEYSYAFKAHFDFVITEDDSSPIFAVEFDGSQHYTDPATIERDNKKNAICEKLIFRLIRIDAQYLKRVQNFTIIGFLTRLWFIYDSFLDAQREGIISSDEPFQYFGVVGYDLAASARAYIRKLWNEKRIQDYTPKTATAIDDQGYLRAIATVKIQENLTVLGHFRLRFFMIHPFHFLDDINWLIEDFAAINAAEKLKSYFKGKYQPLKDEEVQSWHNRFSEWRSLEHWLFNQHAVNKELPKSNREFRPDLYKSITPNHS